MLRINFVRFRGQGRKVMRKLIVRNRDGANEIMNMIGEQPREPACVWAPGEARLHQ